MSAAKKKPFLTRLKKIFLAALLSAFPAAILAAAENFNELPAPKNPDWVKNSVLYEVYLRDYSQEGKFGSLETELLRLKNLGVNALVLLPVNPAAVPIGVPA